MVIWADPAKSDLRAIHPTEKSTTPPVAIFVLAGGYLPGAVRDEQRENLSSKGKDQRDR